MTKSGVALTVLALLLHAAQLQADSLRDIYEMALANDAQLKAEEAQYRANLETENLGRSSLLPQINANYDYTDNDRDREALSPNVDSSGNSTPLQTFTNTDTDTEGFAVSLNQALFDMPAWFTFQSGKQVSKQAEATFAANQQNLIVRVVEAYLAVLRAQDNLEASKAQERAFERQLEQTQQRFEVGLIAITDVHEARAAHDLARVNRITDENNVQVALEQLSVLTGKRHGDLNVLAEDFKVEPADPPDRSRWVEFALANNFSLKAAEYNEEAARQVARANRMEHLPKVRGSYEYSDYETDGDVSQVPESLFLVPPEDQVETTRWQIRLDVPLFAGGAISANRRKAAQEYNAARENRINLSRNTVTNTRSLHMTVNNDVARVAARKQSIVSSASALDATQAGYEVGTRNVVDVLNAQNTLFSAQRDYANSRYDYINNILRLKEQAGLLSPEDVYQLDSFLEVPPAPTASENSSK
jgi:outer membrane protein